MPKIAHHSLDTQVIHAGEPRPRIEGAITPPIFQTSTYTLAGEEDYHDLRYLRLSNSPNHLALHAKLAALECAERALVAASGMSAITTALLCALKSGDHLLAQSGLYGGTHTFMTHELPDFGIDMDFVDLNDRESWREKLRDNTRAFYVESMTNPLLEVGDLAAVVEFARANELVAVIDNTLTSPVNFRPLEIGFDLVVHSATKYLNGHSDIVAGVIAGDAAHVDAAKRKLDHLGGTLDAHACFLLHRGIKTLPLRVARQNDTALALARFLRDHPAVGAVHYAGLPDHPTAARAKSLFSGFGGVLSFDHNDGADGARQMIRRLELAAEAVSLGGVETLIARPAQTSHVGLSQTERDRIGIGDGLVRVAVGVEGADDLIADFEQALSK
ncbi:MAG: trans-sulfuration enzyme family protein [bacterium]